MTKEKMEAAVRKGQGVTASGVELQPLTIECIGPGGAAIIVDCLTDNKLRAMQEVKYIITKHGGNVTPTAYLFARKGKILLSAAPKYTGSFDELYEEVLEKSMEIDGVEDVEVAEDDDKWIEITTNPEKAGQVAKQVIEMTDSLKLEKSSVEWIPNEDTIVEAGEGKEWDNLADMMDKLEEVDDVTQVWDNLKGGDK